MIQETTIPAAKVKQLQIVVIALVTGVILFCLVAIFLATSYSGPTPPADTLMPLRLIHLVLCVLIIAATRIIPPMILSGKISPRNPAGEPPSFVQKYVSATIVHLALLEGMTLFGLVVFMTAATGGKVFTDSTYYLHFLPLLFFILQAKILFPTEEKFNELQRQYGE